MTQKTWTWESWILSVVDGDTFKVIADRGRKDYSELTVRLARVDAAELRTEEGVSTKLWVRAELLRRGHVLTGLNTAGLVKATSTRALLTAALGNPVSVVSHGLDKYGRILGDVVMDAPGGDLADLLLATGRARPYDGGPR